MLLAAMLAMAVMMAAPAIAMADDFDGDGFEDFVEDFGFFPFVFEVDDVDCDGFDDDFDGGIDEDVVCVVEFEVDDFDGFDFD
jgi:hypothetical protein